MSVFYRYIRPKRFNPKRVELITLPQGGICLRFERLPEGDLFFTYSRCHPSEHFNKDVARVIADDRAKVAKENESVLGLLRRIPDSQLTDLLVHACALRCAKMEKELENEPSVLVRDYMAHEYFQFGEHLKNLYARNIKEEEHCESWKRVNADLWQIAYKAGEK